MAGNIHSEVIDIVEPKILPMFKVLILPSMFKFQLNS